MGLFGKPAAVLFHEDVESVTGNPHAGLIRAVIAMGIAVGAKEVVFGVPEGVTLDESAERVEEEKLRTWGRENLAGFREPEEWVKQSMPLVLESGLDTVPMYYLVEGKYERHQGLPGVTWIYLPVYFEMLRVSIGGTRENPQPRRYVELERTKGERRRFAEVELVMGRDNALRIRLFGTREEEATVQVSPAVSGPLVMEPEKVERFVKQAKEWARKHEKCGG